MQIAMRHARTHQIKCADLCEYLNRSISRQRRLQTSSTCSFSYFFLIRDLCSIYIFHSRLSSAAVPRFNAEKKVYKTLWEFLSFVSLCFVFIFIPSFRFYKFSFQNIVMQWTYQRQQQQKQQPTRVKENDGKKTTAKFTMNERGKEGIRAIMMEEEDPMILK